MKTLSYLEVKTRRSVQESVMKDRIYTASVVAVLASLVTPASAAIVAGEDFDGGALNLISGFNPAADNLDGGGGDWFGVGDLGAWPQGTGVPFSLADDSVIDVSGGTRDAGNAFPADLEGVFGQARDVNDAFFGISDTREWLAPTASWTFDITGISDLQLSIGLGAQADDSFGGFNAESSLTFTVQIDGGTVQTAFDLAPDPAGVGFAYRAMDSGSVPLAGSNGPLAVTGDNPVSKYLAEDGALAGDIYLNKTPASGLGGGALDTFSTAINGTGSQLTLTLTADLPFEAMAFDDIVITGVPEPTSLSFLGLAGLLAFIGRRCQS
jgi:hypothetical protein